MDMRKVGLAATTIAIAGCQTWGPTWSELSGDRYTAVAVDRRPAILISVGSESIGSVVPYRVAPGQYDVVVESPRHNQFRGSEKTIRLTIEPCRRYYINAQFEDPVRPDWTPVVDYVDTIPGCTVPAR